MLPVVCLPNCFCSRRYELWSKKKKTITSTNELNRFFSTSLSMKLKWNKEKYTIFFKCFKFADISFYCNDFRTVFYVDWTINKYVYLFAGVCVFVFDGNGIIAIPKYRTQIQPFVVCIPFFPVSLFLWIISFIGFFSYSYVCLFVSMKQWIFEAFTKVFTIFHNDVCILIT